MKTTVFLLAALLALAGLAVAQSDCRTSCDDPDGGADKGPNHPSDAKPDDRPDGKPGDKADDGKDGNKTREKEPERVAARTAEPFEYAGEHTSFRFNGTAILDYRVDGVLVAERIMILVDAPFKAQREGRLTFLSTLDAKLVLHDDATGLMKFSNDDIDLAITFPADTTFEEKGAGLKVLVPGGSPLLLRTDDADRDGTDVTLHGFATLHMPPRDNTAKDPARQDKADGADRDRVSDKVQEALEKRHVGAEVEIRKPGPMRLAAGGDAVNILRYDDVEVHVTLPEDQATVDQPLRIVVSSELTEGRTIVLDVDPALLPSLDPAQIQLRYFDLDDEGGAQVEREVPFAAASSLADVLDPTDDAGAPEYYIVQDQDGLHVLVSVPHWSVHAITLASAADLVSEPRVIVGIVIGVLGTILAAVVLLWPRKPRVAKAE